MQIASVRHTYERPARLARFLIALLLLASNSLIASAAGSADRIDALLARAVYGDVDHAARRAGTDRPRGPGDPLAGGLSGQPGDRITIHHLLNHTVGIVGYTEIPTWAATVRNPYTPMAFLAHFSTLDLLFEPGAKFSYSNSGYFLLGVILEKVTGQSYETLRRERIFAPVGMNDSGHDSTQPLLAKRAARRLQLHHGWTPLIALGMHGNDDRGGAVI
jgi:hypothetical protein